MGDDKVLVGLLLTLVPSASEEEEADVDKVLTLLMPYQKKPSSAIDIPNTFCQFIALRK